MGGDRVAGWGRGDGGEDKVGSARGGRAGQG